MTYAEAIQFLYGLQVFGANLGLERMQRLAELAGHPEKKLRFIHVAGTNGKGSTCAMLESIYRAAGLRVGLFTSPHLVSFRERMQINRQLISQAEVTQLVAEFQPLLKAFPGGNHPTMFEIVTGMALKFFAKERCDLVIWETGLGGRLDATNIVTSLASVITNIGLDHTEWLGDTLEKIAAEKAGIIKPGVPVITAENQPEALAIIETTAGLLNAPLTQIRNSKFEIKDLKLSLPGEHQKQNAALALATVDVLQNQIPVSPEQVEAGLQNASWPGRLQLIRRGGQNLLLDGAHNVAGAEALRAALESLLPPPAKRGERQRENQTSSPRPYLPPLREERAKPVLIFGALADKNWPAICRMLAPLVSKIIVTPVASKRTAAPAELAAVFRQANPQAAVTVVENFSAALSACKDEPLLVITGSLYLVGEALERLEILPSDEGGRDLNEWSARKSWR